jgi:hypothetical protein
LDWWANWSEDRWLDGSNCGDKYFGARLRSNNDRSAIARPDAIRCASKASCVSTATVGAIVLSVSLGVHTERADNGCCDGKQASGIEIVHD